MSTSWQQEAGMASGDDLENIQGYTEQALQAKIDAEAAEAEAQASAVLANDAKVLAQASQVAASSSAQEASTSASSITGSVTAAQAAQIAAESAKALAEQAESDALGYANNASTSAGSAQTQAGLALEYKDLANTAKDEAVTAKNVSVSAAASTAGSAQQAIDAKDAAVVAKDLAVIAQGASESARTGSEAAKVLAQSAASSVTALASGASQDANDANASRILAEDARDEAELAADDASSSVTTISLLTSQAQSAKDLSETAKVGSETAKGLAEAAKLGAEQARDLAEGYRDNALTYKDQANTYAQEAAASAVSASNASTSETNAAASATSASQSATASQSSYENALAIYGDINAVSQAVVDTDVNKDLTLGYRNEAEGFKDQAYTYSQSAASAVAYQDLTAIAQTKAVSAVDVFVYDTSKDSDGGAWRQRTQGTSWYNETLNTATRGSRKEFPAVAVIVAEAGKVTIYDGDDPSMPMWMVFPSRDAGFISTTNSIKAVTALNGKLLRAENRGSSVGYGVGEADFIKDTMRLYTNSSQTSRIGLEPITGRATQVFYLVGTVSEDYIVSAYVNDVAMTVLPNAPIDPATGLPIPTIAVATDGGVSVIKDDGTVVDIVASLFTIVADEIEFTSENYVYFACDSSDAVANRIVYVEPIPTSDLVYTDSGFFNTTNANERYIRNVGGAWNGDLIIPFGGSGPINTPISTFDNTIVFGSGEGLGLISRDKETPSNGMVNVVTSEYNTGWMNGDIKLATLSDTDDTDLVGSELVTNGTFDSDSDWTKGTGWSIAGGKAISQNTAISDTLTPSVNIGMVQGKSYAFTFNIVDYTSGSLTFAVFDGAGGASPQFTNVGKFTWIYTAVRDNDQFVVRAAPTFTGSIDNISVRLAEEDRSVNGNGLQVFGTVTREPVATGADLVAYSGFSGTNYLVQPYNSDLDFGTGDFCIMGWAKQATAALSGRIISRDDGGGRSRLCVDLASGYYRGFITDSTGASKLLTSSYAPNGNWEHVCFMRSSGFMYIYVNGISGATPLANADDISNDDASLYVGVSGVTGSRFDGSLALWRISATAPTAEQIAKIYRDEKVLFQEGAQATLYGTSDAVTALAYDTDTTLLHVGSSAGRSVFQGLQRVDNTTDAVGTAISASNGLVAEE